MVVESLEVLPNWDGYDRPKKTIIPKTYWSPRNQEVFSRLGQSYRRCIPDFERIETFWIFNASSSLIWCLPESSTRHLRHVGQEYIILPRIFKCFLFEETDGQEILRLYNFDHWSLYCFSFQSKGTTSQFFFSVLFHMPQLNNCIMIEVMINFNFNFKV